MKSTKDEIKDELYEIKKEMESRLTLEEVAAQQIVKLERKYYYGDTGNNRRFEQLRGIVASCAEESVDDSPKD